MYEIGEMIVYGGEGVCKVESIGVPQLSGGQTTDSRHIFYTLIPVYRNGKIFAPVDGKTFTRPVISRQAAIDLIRSIPDMEPMEYCGKDTRSLSEQYQVVLSSHECTKLVSLIKAVDNKRKTAVKMGRKLGQTDERYMKRAQDMLFGELSVVLDIPREDISDYINDAVSSILSGENWNG